VRVGESPIKEVAHERGKPNKMFRKILMPLTATLSGETVLDAALALARKVNANIRAMFILPNPHTAPAYIPYVVLAAEVNAR
jgi:hypothetical protein